MSMWDDEAGYDRDDPKHPAWREGMARAADYRRKAFKEDVSVDDKLIAATKAVADAQAAVTAAIDALKSAQADALGDAMPW